MGNDEYTFGLQDIDANAYISLLGLDPEHLGKTPAIRSAVRTDVQSGGLHGLTYVAKKNKRQGYDVKVTHWVRHPDGVVKSKTAIQLTSILDGHGRYTLTQAKLFGRRIQYKNDAHFFLFLSQVKDILREIRHHHLPPLKTLLDLQRSFIPEDRPYKQGMDQTGQPLFYAPKELLKETVKDISKDARKDIANDASAETDQPSSAAKKKQFSVPNHILPALLGYHSDLPTDDRPIIAKIASGHLQKTYQPVFSKAQIRRFKNGTIQVSVQAWKQKRARGKDGVQKNTPVTWFNLQFQPDRANPGHMVLSSAKCCGKYLQLDDTPNIVRLCRATASAVHQIRSKEEIPHLQKILHDNGMHDIVNQPHQSRQQPIPQQGRMTFNVLGGNNVQDVKFNESRIGANGYLYTYQKPDQDKPDAILVDAGVLFLKRDKHGYDGAFINPDHILPHRETKLSQPEMNVRALVCTHSHEDHVGAIPHLVKAGYIVPPIICSDITEAFIKEKLKALGIDQKEWPQFREIAAYQYRKIGAFRLRAIPMSHSAPSLAFRIATPAGSVLHLGDWKMDPSIKVGYGTDRDLLKRMSVDTVVSDSTSVLREGKAVEERIIEDNFHKFFTENAEKRPIVALLGSNLNRLVTILRAGARAGKTPVIMGHSLDVSRRILNKVGFINPETGEHTTLKKYIQSEFGISIKTATSKAGKALLQSGDVNALPVVTGTHNEALSATDKMLAWMHRDIELRPDQDILMRSQRAIPGSDDEYRLLAKRAAEQGVPIIDPGSPEAKGLDLYASGHGHSGDLAELINLVSAKYFVPVHGDAIQLQAHARLIKQQNKIPVLVNNQNVVDIRKGHKPHVIGNRVESWAYYEHQRPANQYYGGGVRYEVSLANPILSGSWADLGNVPESLVTYDHDNEADYHIETSQSGAVMNYAEPIEVSGSFGDIWRTDFTNLTFYDCETTALKNGEIVQFAAVTVKQDNTVEETDIRQRIPDHVLPSPMACMVIGVSPYQMRGQNGLEGKDFAKNLYEHFTKLSKIREKSLAVGHNNLNADDDWIRKTLHKYNYSNVYVTNTNGMRRADTLQMARAVHLYAPSALKIPMVDGRPSFRLGALVQENDLLKNIDGAHDALFDVRMTQALFNHMLKKAPKIAAEMLRRCDYTNNQNWLLGNGMGIQSRPLVTYGVNSAQGMNKYMGMLVNLDLDLSFGRKAIMMNLNEDPQFFDTMSVEEIAAMLADKKQNRLHILSLNKQPVILPAKYGLAVNANKNIDERVLLERQQNVLRHPERNHRIRDGVALYLRQRRMEIDPYYVEDFMYPKMTTHFERQAFNDDKKILKKLDPSNDVSPEEIAHALYLVKHDYSRRVLEERLLWTAPELLSDDRKEQLLAERRMALRAPANSPKMTLKQFWQEIEEITQAKDMWVGDDPEKEKILQELKQFGQEFSKQVPDYKREEDENRAGVALRQRLGLDQR